MEAKGNFISIWDGGIIKTPAILNTETGEVTTDSVETDDLGNLMEESFEDSEGDEHEICPDCHEYILYICMEPGIGHTLNEVKKCKNPDCEYNN